MENRIWKNKKTGELNEVQEMWLQDKNERYDIKRFGKGISKRPTLVKGSFFHVGWLIKNKHGIWVGFPLEASELYDEIK